MTCRGINSSNRSEEIVPLIICRDVAMSVLAKEPLGSFMVRNSETQPGTFALSVRVPKSFHPLGITHYIIHQLEEGYQIKVTKNVDQKNV